MVSICLYFQVHQPFRIKNYTIFDIGKNQKYFEEKQNLKINNEAILRKVANKCYLPANKLMLKLIKEFNINVSYSISGIALEQFELFYPEVINSFQELADTRNVEFINETYYHSLSYLYSKKEFIEQIKLHKNKIKNLFNFNPKTFRNTELIYNNEIAKLIEDLDYNIILAEGWDNCLKGRSPNFVYSPKNCSRLKLLLKNYKLSDDIAFRFGEKSWSEWPLTAEKFTRWINSVNGECVNLFMDYETIGEHQWEETGIFNFLEKLPKEVLKNKYNNFKTPSEIISSYSSKEEIDIPNLISWADTERDLSAWTGNKMQKEALQKLYSVEKFIKENNNKILLDSWRKLQTSDHFYYMCTKWFNDGDVHKYFSPYNSPYEAFINYMNVLNDLTLRLKNKEVVLDGRETC